MRTRNKAEGLLVCWTLYTFSLLVVVCNTSTGGSMFPTSSFLSALIKLPKNAVCQVCQLWKWLLLLLDNETWVPYYLSCATRSGSMKRGISQKNIIFRIENWKLIWRRQFFLEVGIIFQKMVAEVELFALLKNLNFSFEDWKLIYHWLLPSAR